MRALRLDLGREPQVAHATQHQGERVNEQQEPRGSQRLQSGAAFENGHGGGGARGFGSDFGSAFSDIFEGIFGMAGGGRGQGGRERGADLRYNMEITLEDAFGGKAAEIRIPTSVTCETC